MGQDNEEVKENRFLMICLRKDFLSAGDRWALRCMCGNVFNLERGIEKLTETDILCCTGKNMYILFK